MTKTKSKPVKPATKAHDVFVVECLNYWESSFQYFLTLEEALAYIAAYNKKTPIDIEEGQGFWKLEAHKITTQSDIARRFKEEG